jgi:hypothetical protein
VEAGALARQTCEAAIVKIRPEAREKLRQGFQQKAERQRRLYEGQLAEAQQLAARFGCGEVAGIFSTRTPDPDSQRRRKANRAAWLYAFSGGFMVLDGPRSDSIPVPWSQVTGIREVWTRKTFADWEPSRPLLTAYELHLADGQTRFISLSYRNMLDPYPAIGREMRALAPADLAATWPKLPLIREIILAHAGRPDPAGEGASP